MKGILQQYDVEASAGAARMEQEIRERSASLGREATRGAHSARGRSAGGSGPAPTLGKPTLGYTNNITDSAPVLGAGGVENNIRLGESFDTVKRGDL